jgi:hypothetical protein
MEEMDAVLNHRNYVFAFFLAIATASACTVVVQEPRPVVSRPQACTFEHAPVCARRGNRMQSFGNACTARAAGFQVVRRGECRASVPASSIRPIACTREFAPVCAVRGNLSRSFDNACLARASGFRPLRQGRCR